MDLFIVSIMIKHTLMNYLDVFVLLFLTALPKYWSISIGRYSKSNDSDQDCEQESFIPLSDEHSPLLFPLACPGSCLMQCPLVLYQKSTSVGSALMPQQKMPSGCHRCPWAWIMPLQQLQPLTTTPATYPIPPLHHTGKPIY